MEEEEEEENVISEVEIETVLMGILSQVCLLV